MKNLRSKVLCLGDQGQQEIFHGMFPKSSKQSKDEFKRNPLRLNIEESSCHIGLRHRFPKNQKDSQGERLTDVH